MAVTVYLFDKNRRVRAPLGPGDAVDLIHDENNHKITVSVSARHAVKNGEYIGFACVDGHYRLFCVTEALMDDDKRMIDVTATDAIVQDMKEAIIEDKQLLDVNLTDALLSYVPDETWAVTGDAPDRLEKSRAYYATLWEMLTTLEQLYEWKVDAFYVFDGGAIVEKELHMRSAEPIFRGRIFQAGRDASKITVTKSGRPITRLYGLGKSTGTEDEPSNLTFADVVWSVADGDPVDKPKGQTWVEDPEAVAEEGVHTDKYVAQDAETAEDLLQRTWEELQKKKQPSVTVKATVADMEMVEGYTHQQIRLGDLVAVVLREGTIVEAKIIAIKRNYTRTWLTTITIGEKTASIQTQVSSLITSATHTFERLTIYKNRFQEDEALIQLNAEHIQLNAETIIQHAELFIQLETANKDVLLRLDGVNNELIAQAGMIKLQAEEIELKADTTYVDNLVSQYIKADEIETKILNVVDRAYVMGLLSTEELDVGSLVASSVNTEWLSADSIGADSLSAGSLSIGGNAVSLTGMTVVTNVSAIFDDSENVIGVNVTRTPITFYQ